MPKQYRRILVVLVIIFVLNALILVDALTEIKHVDISDYEVTTDYGTLNQTQVQVMDDILEAAANEVSEIDIPELTDREWHEVLTHLGLYYGSMERVYILATVESEKVTLNLELFNELAMEKIIIDARVDEAVSTLVEGTDEFKLWQICNYLSKKITYISDNRETIDGLNGKGVCVTYSMLFYKMASRLGIRTYICYGYAGEYHAWNMVIVGGKSRHYDVTWYDGVLPIFHYIYNGDAWGREFQLNNIWWEESM